jgi:predicted AAA+ superfamily ATPase
MKRSIEHYLQLWKTDPSRKSLLIRGARQVGKTFTVRKFGKSFANMVEVNFEKDPILEKTFDADLNPRRIVRDLSLVSGQAIEPGRTLLFLDEVQQVPRALTALRYFHEEMPGLHVIAAGSLIDFALDEVGIPVGRVSSLHMYPMSFTEFLGAKGKGLVIEALSESGPESSLGEAVHRELLRDLGEYLAVGGMPEAVREWIEHEDLARCARVHVRLIETCRQDFSKYSKKHQVKYVDLVFDEVPRFLGRKFVFSRLRGNWRRRDLQPALDLLAKASMVHTVCRTAATGVPLGAEADPERFKALFLDVALAQSLLGSDGGEWILDAPARLANAGEVVEAFVGQELLAYGDARRAALLHYWHREERSSSAEVDYVISTGPTLVPVEVKCGARGRLTSLRNFLDSRGSVAPYGVRLSTHPFSAFKNLHDYPLYAVASFACRLDECVKRAIQSLR